MYTGTAKQKLQSIFWIIVGVATAGSTFILSVMRTEVGFYFVVAEIFQALCALGLARRWFHTWTMRPGRVIHLVQWVAGITAGIAIFDVARRLIGKIPAINNELFFTADGIAILLFILWLVVSYFIQKDVKERKVCEFC